jgi:tRNA(Arg) A34 adenosine deaminase TadA
MRATFRTLLGLSLLALTATGAIFTPALPDDPSATDEDRRHIARTYELARESSQLGDGGHGALLVKNGQVLLEFKSAGNSSGDLTKHAETGLISLASRTLGPGAFAGATLYTSEEPCIMCCGSIRAAGIHRMVYGVTAVQAKRVGGRSVPSNVLQCREVYRRLEYPISICGPLMEQEGLKVTALQADRAPSQPKSRPE